MTTDSAPAEAEAQKTAWLKEAASFLEGKSPAELYRIYQTFVTVDPGDGVMDRFMSAMRAHFAKNPELALATARLLLSDTDRSLHKEVYWILKDIMFTNPEAMTMIWDTLLSDPDDDVFDEVYVWMDEDLHDAEEAPLSSFLYAAERILQHKDRYERRSQTPR